jgi:hypothetical protein
MEKRNAVLEVLHETLFVNVIHHHFSAADVSNV